MSMKREENHKKSILYGAIVFLLLILLINFSTAGFVEWFNKITGKATSGTTAPNITIINSAPEIHNVSDIAAVTLTEGLGFNISFNFTASDIDGSGDLDNATAFAQINKTGETTRANNPSLGYANSSCLPLAFVQGNNITYGCNLTVYYFDGNGDWSVNVTISDLSGATVTNISTFVTINLLTSMTINPPTLNWTSVSLSDLNQGSSNDPLVINNTGNDINLSIMVTAYSLQGEITTTQNIPAANFKVDGVTEGCSGTAMVNATSTNVTAATLNKGNNTIQAGDVTSGQEEIFFCLTSLPAGLSAQAYSTQGSVADWSILAQT